jgi:hypothetical protein
MPLDLVTMAYLEIKKGRAILQSGLDEEAMSIGRLPGNSIVVNDPDISRRHCVIERWEGRYSIYDLGSRNGTKVNGARVQRTDLKHGDTITIGKTVVKFLEAPLNTPAAKQSAQRSARWLAACAAVLVCGAAVAWVTGLIGGGGVPDSARAQVDSDSAPNDVKPTIPSTTRSHSRPSNDDGGAERDHPPPLVRGATNETALWMSHYQSINPESLAAESDRLLGRPCSARFTGRPDEEHGVTIWGLAPDDQVIAVLEPKGSEAEQLLTALVEEPMLVEVELAGLLQKEASGTLRLHVGVVEVLGAWMSGKDEALQQETRDLINKRVIFNPRYTAQAIEARQE